MEKLKDGIYAEYCDTGQCDLIGRRAMHNGTKYFVHVKGQKVISKISFEKLALLLLKEGNFLHFDEEDNILEMI